ncbi:hypothetical protein VNI00_003024 [Paramarasmius palmivorus]|uniref:F-box domain-containing protein n=1 Tax=Paramarasmius palmivorus TaxID=297713 RepID=A0AAW0DZD0_9AGAR
MAAETPTPVRTDASHRRKSSLPHDHESLQRVKHIQILPPIHHLPNEILREIFLQWHALDSDRELSIAGSELRTSLLGNHSLDSLNTNRPLWICAQVCRKWRLAAFLCTSWWTSLHIQIPEPSSASETKRNVMVHNLTSILRWTRDFPITVELLSFHPFGPGDPLLSAICAHSSRWEKLQLNFYFHDFDLLPTMFLSVKGKLPLLRSLALGLGARARPGIVLGAFEEAPKLKTISICGSQPVHHLLKVPWTKVTDFRRHRHSLYGLDSGHNTSMDDLVQMTNIVHYYDMVFHCPPGPPIELPRLQRMVVRMSGPSIRSHWERFQMSGRFTELRICDDSRESVSIESLVSFLVSCGPSLRTLYLDNVVLPECELIQVSQRLTSLTLFSYLYRRASVKNTLAVALADTRFLPRLESFVVYGWPTFSCEMLMDMLSARVSQGTSTFKRLGLPLRHSTILEMGLGQFRERGFEIIGVEEGIGVWRQCLQVD